MQLNLLKHIASDKLGSFSKPTLLKCTLVNAHSICNKIPTFHHFVSDNKLDICCVTETWIKPNDNSTPSCLPPINFSSHNTIRNGKTGGGLAFVLHNSIQYYFEDGNVTCLVLLDLSAAFDTVNHKILLQRLQHRYGIKGVVLKWLESYLTEYQQCVIIDGELSEPALLKQGVPQGSILNPILFTLYTAPLGNICHNHGIPYMTYADDHQLYVAFKTISQVHYVKCMESISTCVTDIQHWMNVNYLKLNRDKTGLIFLCTPQQLAKCCEIIPDNIILLGDNIKPAAQVHNLGYWIDPSLKNHSYIIIPALKRHCKDIAPLDT